MKKYIAFVLMAAVLLSLFFGCTSKTTEDIANQDQLAASLSGLTLHKIGVATYDIKDAQIRMFKNYLDNYIKECFSDVTFLYSNSISGSEDLMDFLELCCENDVEGVLVFGSYDLQKEVEFCAAHGMYYIRPTATSSEADFQSVAANPYFVGEIGPGADSEYQAGADMVKAMAQTGKRYVILSGGGYLGNEMHRLRTVGILDALQDVYGVRFARSTEDLALTKEPVTIEAGELKAVVCPGYLAQESALANATEVIASGDYTTVLSTVPITPLTDALNDTNMECGVIDCFSEENYFGFQSGRIAYVAGKYESEIGPGFAALYNAITGHGDTFRENGRAFRLKQGFWTAASMEAYDSMYALAAGAAVNAYNYEDLYAVVQSITPEASFDSFRSLVESYRYEDCLARRSA
ncbi:MAG: hypothetical protein ACI3WQ_12325 [Faecousia sp.]